MKKEVIKRVAYVVFFPVVWAAVVVCIPLLVVGYALLHLYEYVTKGKTS